ncbi:MAG: DUF2357 domain-containing protein [Bacteroidota bacterium]
MADLLTIVTDRVRISWTGPSVPATAPGHEVRVRTFRSPAEVASETERQVADPEVRLPLALPEEATLSLLVQGRTDETVEVFHRDLSQTNGLVLTEGGRVMHGRIRVRDEAGRSTFVVRVDERPEIEVSWRVLPVKLNVAQVATMREEIEAVWTGAARRAWGAATEESAPGGERSSPAWVAVLREVVRRLEPAILALSRNPETVLLREARVRPASRLRGDAASVAAIRKGKGRGAWLDVSEIPVREHMPVSVLRSSGHAAVHRWIRARLDRAIRRLAALRREEGAHPHAEHGRRLLLREDLARIDDALHRIVRIEPLAGVSGARAPKRAPLVLRRRPSYRQAFESLQLLDAGLAVAEGEIETAWMGTARLFETWAALAVVQEAASVIGAKVPMAPFGVIARGARVRVRRGREASVRLVGSRGELEVAYEPRFGGSPALLTQRPDLFLTFHPPGQPARRAVLDAKYRRDDSVGYLRRHGAPSPPEDALGDLHRYRDAIVDTGGQPLLERAAALYPHEAADTFASSRLWCSHEAVGIGAVPLVPGDRAWLRAWLDAWISGPA